MPSFRLDSMWSEKTGTVELFLLIDENKKTKFLTQHTPKRDHFIFIYHYDTYKEAYEKYEELSKHGDEPKKMEELK